MTTPNYGFPEVNIGQAYPHIPINLTFNMLDSLLGGFQPLDAQLTSLAGLVYAGNSLKVIRVNAGETAFELATISGGATDLSYTAATRIIASSTGTDATLPLVTTGDAGLAPASGGGTANYLRADGTWAAPPGTSGSGDVTGPASSVDNEIALFSGVTGKVIKRATTTGLLKAASGVIAAAVSSTDYAPATSGTSILKGDGSGGFSNATAGTDYDRPLVLVATLAGDQATAASVTPVTLTGLVFTYEANSKYRIWFMGRVQPTAATTGCGFQFDLSSAVTAIDVQFYHQLANTGTLSGGHSIADDASVGVSSGMPGTSTYPVTGEGLLVTGANTGTAQLRFRAEVAAVTTCKAGFTLVVEKIA